LALASVSLRQEGETRAALVQSTTELARHLRDLWADFKTKSPLDFASFFQDSLASVLSDAAAAILCSSLDRNWPEAAYQKSRCGKRRERIEGWAVGGQEWRLNPQQQAVSEIGPMSAVGLTRRFDGCRGAYASGRGASLRDRGLDKPRRAAVALIGGHEKTASVGGRFFCAFCYSGQRSRRTLAS